MKPILAGLLTIALFISCKKKEKTIDEPTPEVPKTYSFSKTFLVWDSVRLTPAVLNNYSFKLTVFKNNQPDKIIYSQNNKVRFENFAVGKYDILIEDPLNNFTSLRDTMYLDTTANYLPAGGYSAQVMKYPGFHFKRYSVSESDNRVNITLTTPRLTQPAGYCVFFNTKNTLITSYKNQLFDYDSNQMGESEIMESNGPGFMYRIQSTLSKANATDTISGGAFTIYPNEFKQHYKFNAGDSIYFFVVPAAAQYYFVSYISDYTSKYDNNRRTVVNYNAINLSKAISIGYKFH